MSVVREDPGSPEIVWLHEFFERTARRWPEATAIDVPPGDTHPTRRTVTYRQLQQQSDALAIQLRTFIAESCVVAILLPRNAEHLYRAQLAVLKAGASYLCMDPAFPDEQIRQILEDSDAVALLTDLEGLSRIDQAGIAVRERIDVTTAIPVPSHPVPALLPAPWLTPDSLAYTIYTSGTTGRPKGVQIAHKSIVNLVRSDLDEFRLTPEDRVAQGSSAAYDSSVEEVWLALAAGGTVVVMDDDTVRLGPDLVPWLHRERITVLCPPPTLLRTTGCENPEEALPDLRLLYVGGEALTRDVADRWARGRRLVNGYGPTECTVTALRADILPDQEISIGAPVPGLQAWALDENLAEVADNTPGELCLGGIGLALGYHARPELTAEKFVLHPRLGRIYRTGDLVHRTPEGQFFYHGRIDTQVKLRGYRIELEAIESCLAQCEGVREAACRVQGDGGQQILVAFVVPVQSDCPPSFDTLKAALLHELPAYMVPTLFGLLSELPKGISGKVKRDALPELAFPKRQEGRLLQPPRDAVESKLTAAIREILALPDAISIHDDFFNDLSGNSLQAARLVSRLRDDPGLASLAVRDIYEAPTVAELARRVMPLAEGVPSHELLTDMQRGKPMLATLLQTLWLLIELLVGAPLLYLIAFYVLPWLLASVDTILLAPFLLFAGLAVYTFLTVLATLLAKRALIGTYRPLRAPVWSGFYVRNWMVQQLANLVPWSLLAGTEFQCMALRALGARIGQRVHIHRGVNLSQGGWDLLDIGDDVTIGQDAMIGLVELEEGCIVVGTVALEHGATLDVRAGVGPNTVLEPDSYLTALSSLPAGGCIPRGEQWDGIPATRVGRAPMPPALPEGERLLSPVTHATVLILAQCILWSILALPWQALALGTSFAFHLNSAHTWLSLLRSTLDLPTLASWIAYATLPIPLTLLLEALLSRALGRIPEGVISRWSPAYIRVWLKAGLVDSAGEWLSGALFWPHWLRLAGMKIGADCEISTIIDVIPEMIDIGPSTFFADGIYLGGPRIHRGTVTLAKVTMRKNSFLGNHVVVPAGQNLPEDILLGVCTVADDRAIHPGSSWFGLPPFELPRREVVDCDARLTHNPSLIRYLNRVFWETLRFALPIVPMLVFLGWLCGISAAEERLSMPVLLAVAVPLLTLASAAALCLCVLVLKWALLGRVRPGTHALWSCWCSRWDFLYVAWGVWAGGTLRALEGTLLLSGYLRAMGVRLGKQVVLGSGFSQVVDPDMLIIEEGATVNAMFQAHTFEDRVLKIDTVRIGKRATLGSASVPLYGAEVGAHAYVAPHSVIMKRERLLPGQRYEGAPTRLERTAAVQAVVVDRRPGAAIPIPSRESSDGLVR